MIKLEHILIAYDDSEQAERALGVAIELALRLKAKVTLVTVVEPLPSYVQIAVVVDPALPDTLRQAKCTRLKDLQSRACGKASEQGLEMDTILLDDSEVSGLLNAIHIASPDILVIGRQAHLSSIELPGTVRGIVNQTSCPILAVA